MIVSTGGINWDWFIEYHIEDDMVVIDRHYRLHKGEFADWPEKCKTAPSHPNYYGKQQLKEDKNRDRKSTRLNSSHSAKSRMPSSA